MLRFAELAYGNVDEHREKNKKVAEVPFNSTNKYQVSSKDFYVLQCSIYLLTNDNDNDNEI